MTIPGSIRTHEIIEEGITFILRSLQADCPKEEVHYIIYAIVAHFSALLRGTGYTKDEIEKMVLLGVKGGCAGWETIEPLKEKEKEHL